MQGYAIRQRGVTPRTVDAASKVAMVRTAVAVRFNTIMKQSAPIPFSKRIDGPRGLVVGMIASGALWALIVSVVL